MINACISSTIRRSLLEIPLRCLVLVGPPGRHVLRRVRNRSAVDHLRPKPLGKFEQRTWFGEGQADAIENADCSPCAVGIALESISDVADRQIFCLLIAIKSKAKRFGTALQLTTVGWEVNAVSQAQRLAVERSRIANHEPNSIRILGIDRPTERIGIDVGDGFMYGKGIHNREVVGFVQRADVGAAKYEVVRECVFVVGAIKTRFGVGKLIGQLDQRIVGIGHLDGWYCYVCRCC
mmetsp:Transcript_5546/g.13293  ORF Transcript_5546/g.13293 Transcript_5546/m.13293 type:complete len:236 (+) Transcript_5546:28-735(+)